MAKKCKSCENLRKELDEVKDELSLIRFELNQIREERFSRKRKKKKETEESPKPEPKKNGGKKGHQGWFRTKPTPDKIKIVKAKICPHCCSKKISEYEKIEEHIQEDIVIPKTETILFQKHTYYCKECKKRFTARGENELSNSYIGPTAKSLAVFLKYSVKTSDKNIQEIFEKVFNLKISTASIPGFREQLQKEAEPIYQQLIKALKDGSFIHGDETGWNINGLLVWLWKFSNKKISVSKINKGRGQKEVKEMLGDEFDGVLISDFLSAYNKIKCKKQRCLVHLIRDLDKVIKYWDGRDDDQVLVYCKELKKLFKASIKLYHLYKNEKWDKTYIKKRNAICKKLKDFSFPDPNKKMLKRFAKRLNRHKHELFTFLFEKDVDFHNNHAEQQIRPDVIFRKVTNGNRSDKGAHIHEVIVSVLQTAKLNNIDPLNLFMDILQRKENPELGLVLSPP